MLLSYYWVEGKVAVVALSPRVLELVYHNLKFLRHVKRALQEVAESQYFFVLPLFIIPNDCVFHTLLANQGFDCLADRQLVAQNHQLLIVRQEVTNRVLLEKTANVILHFANYFSLPRLLALVLTFVNRLHSVSHRIEVVVKATPARGRVHILSLTQLCILGKALPFAAVVFSDKVFHLL